MVLVYDPGVIKYTTFPKTGRICRRVAVWVSCFLVQSGGIHKWLGYLQLVGRLNHVLRLRVT